MADNRRFAVTPQLDIEQILMDAQHRWLRPAEICEILKNYQRFRIAPESPNRPPSGSLYLFDRKVLRYFRKDGHNWRKKKDGKTVKEAHERLKCGSIDVLHCYYAHGEENENFQRRSYWMLEEDLMHIVLVHYREVKGNKPSFNRSRDVRDVAEVSYVDSPAGSNSVTTQGNLPSQNTDGESSISAHTSEFEDAESDNYQSSSRYHPFAEVQQYDGSMIGANLLNPSVQLPSAYNQYDFQAIQAGQANSDFYSVAQEDVTRVFDDTGFGLTFNGPKTQVELTSWDEVLEHCSSALQTPPQSSVSFGQPSVIYENPRLEILDFAEIYADDIGAGRVDATNSLVNSMWEFSNSDTVSTVTSNVDVPNNPIEQSSNYPSLMKQLSLELSSVEGERFKKHDSFSRWMSKELGEVVESNVNPSTSLYWNEIGTESVAEDSSISNRDHLDSFIMSPSLSQDQCFSITDFSPSWAYPNLETKVLISGRFLKNKEYVVNCKWSCMFGEVEVPADVLADEFLCCLTPRHKAGRFPFYVTCSNRLACSEIREFEFKDNNSQHMKAMDTFHFRLDKLLSLGPHDCEKLNSIDLTERTQLSSRIRSSMMEADDDLSILLKLSQESGMSPENADDHLLKSALHEKLHTWLLCKVAEDGKGPSILDKEGQGVLHLAAALGYDWAIKPTITAGVNINFRDVHGWTALHWAASFGRERTVVALIALGAASGAVTDPTPEYPLGRTPADLASANGHKGIAGFLAESALTSHLDALTLKEDAKGSDTADLSVLTSADDDFAENCTFQPAEGDTEAGLSLKDSLSAVRNASQAVARIYQVFRVKSFHRKKLVQYGDDNCGMSDERALSLISVKSSKAGKHDSPLNAAAIHIQNKFRGWKGRKEFLITRQRIIKIQAHVRGHQMRKHYKKIVWSVGIVEKAILRWRRKGSGLRGFRLEGLLEGPNTQIQSVKEDDYDFLQKGRRETEDRLQKALARVKSMVQYPEARDQYRRLLTVVGQLQESKAMQENYMDEFGDVANDGLMMLEELCDDETFLYGI